MAGHAARLMFHQQYYVAVICIDLPSDIFCILDVTNLITDAFAVVLIKICLLYTSDAADEEDSVDLCSCHIIKKKKSNTCMLYPSDAAKTQECVTRRR